MSETTTTTTETKAQSMPKLEETPRDKKSTIEVPEHMDKVSLTERKEDEIQFNSKPTTLSSNNLNEKEAEIVENKTFSTIEIDTNPKVEEVKLLLSPEKMTKEEAPPSNVKVEAFSVEGYTDTENMW